MGFFKKLFKGVKKVFKKIGKGIKKVVGKVGKFMSKTGIVGQIALSFLLPGIGGMLGKAAAAMMGSSSAIISGAGTFLNAAVNVATKAGSLVKSVGDGVMKVVGKTIGTALNKIPGAGEFIKGFTKGKIDITKMTNFSGPGGIMDTASKAITDVAAKGGDLFSMDTLTGMNKYASTVSTQLKEGLDRSIEMSQDVSSEDFTKKILEGQDPMSAATTPSPFQEVTIGGGTPPMGSMVGTPAQQGFMKPLTAEDPSNFFKISTETGKLYSADTPGMGYTPSFDSEGFNTSSLLSPSVETLSAEQLAAGQTYDVGSTTGVSQAASRGSSRFSAANVGKAVQKTFGSGFAQDTEAYGSQFAVDIPQSEEYQLYAFGASPLQRSQNQLTTVQYFTGVTA